MEIPTSLKKRRHWACKNMQKQALMIIDADLRSVLRNTMPAKEGPFVVLPEG